MTRILAGFIAGALAVLIFHQPIIIAFKAAGLIPATAVTYNMGALASAPAAVADIFTKVGFAGFPTLFNQMFWGGLLGSLFGLIHGRIPGGFMLIKGIIYGLLVVVVSEWILLPFIKGMLLGVPNQPFFAGFVPERMAVGAILQAGFGMGVGLFYSLMKRT